jgi:hypothetical protein
LKENRSSVSVNIWLFDLDSVLVYPGGYRAAFMATVDHFSRTMGLGGGLLDPSAIETFEACDITSEWDSSAICVAVLIEGIWRADPGLRLPVDLDAALSNIRARAPQPPRADFAAWARRVGQAMADKRYPSDAALTLLLEDASRSPSADGRLVELETCLRGLLEHTRDFFRAPAMRIFQHYTLGSEGFAQHYGIAPAFETPSLLRELDQPALKPARRERVLELTAHGEVHPVIYTARPCWPRSLPGRREDYAPEAEIALELVGLSSLPLVGFGHVSWLAAKLDHHLDYFVKPSPVHALAAVGLAMGGEERAALSAARRLVEENSLDAPLDAWRDQRVDIHVFEDTAGGILGVMSAARQLRQAEVRAEVKAWGIASTPGKRAALEALGVPTFADVNLAIDAASHGFQ